LSGIIGSRHEVSVLDAIVDNIGPKECAKKIIDNDYDAVIFLTGSISWDEDSRFIKEIKYRKGFPVIGTGDIFLEDCKELMQKNDFLDAVILDFTTEDILSYLDKNFDTVKNMVFRMGEEIIEGGTEREFQKEIEIPIPKYELFPNKRYNYPFVLHNPFATVLTDYGCPFKCDFCVMSNIGFKYRKIDNVMAEIKYVKGLGFKDIYFGDQTFGARRYRLVKICNSMINEKINMGWVCWSRVDLVNEDILKLMKMAGCHTILFGVETSNDRILKESKKGFTSAQVKNTFKLCRKLGIRTLGTFVFGLPDEDKDSCLRTINFAKEIGADFASFNVLIPRMNTKIRRLAIERGWIDKELKIMDQSGSFAAMETEKMTVDEIIWLKNKAVRSFYFRPSYILHRLFGIRTLYELRLLILNGRSLIKNTLRI
jgi:radical SAM superfamily enzyme YgiQ (UPF0313 family)